MAENLDLNFEQLIDLGPNGVTQFYKRHKDALDIKWKDNKKFHLIVMICNMYSDWLKHPNEHRDRIDKGFKLAISLLTSSDSDYKRLWDLYPKDQFYQDIGRYELNNDSGLHSLVSDMRASIGRGDPNGYLRQGIDRYKDIFNERLERYKA